MFNFWRKEEPKEDFLLAHYELLGRIFSLDEAKKHLLNVVPAPPILAEEVVRDAAALDAMTRSKGWLVYEKAVWFKLLTALRLSLAAKSHEEREGARHQVLAHLATLHLPYEMKFSADNIQKMKELEREATQ